jgi:hypothetical protein
VLYSDMVTHIHCCTMQSRILVDMIFSLLLDNFKCFIKVSMEMLHPPELLIVKSISSLRRLTDSLLELRSSQVFAKLLFKYGSRVV